MINSKEKHNLCMRRMSYDLTEFMHDIFPFYLICRYVRQLEVSKGSTA